MFDQSKYPFGPAVSGYLDGMEAAGGMLRERFLIERIHGLVPAAERELLRAFVQGRRPPDERLLRGVFRRLFGRDFAPGVYDEAVTLFKRYQLWLAGAYKFGV